MLLFVVTRLNIGKCQDLKIFSNLARHRDPFFVFVFGYSRACVITMRGLHPDRDYE